MPSVSGWHAGPRPDEPGSPPGDTTKHEKQTRVAEIYKATLRVLHACSGARFVLPSLAETLGGLIPRAARHR
jgi:hypothetical protein